MKKAVVLISGGLDSTLAAKMVRDQGVEVVALNCKTPFCLCDKKTSNGYDSQADQAANDLGIELKTINIGEDFLDIIKNPRYGYGKNLNPCIDCRILMFRKAKELMQQTGADFIVTGEVLGQRPMSQHRQALQIIDKQSGLEGLVLRPLSARLLSETLPEKTGWVDRNKLLNFSGRRRKPQMDLAKAFNIKDYPCSAGGCLLTDPLFAKKVRDLLNHGELNLNNIELLKIGRHFRLGPKVKLLVGRDEQENERLLKLAEEGDYLFDTCDIPGPVALGRGLFNDELIRLSCAIVCNHSDLDGKLSIDIVYTKAPEKEGRILKALAISDNELINFRI